VAGSHLEGCTEDDEQSREVPAELEGPPGDACAGREFGDPWAMNW